MVTGKTWIIVIPLVALPLGFFVLAGAIWMADRSLLLAGCLLWLACWGLAAVILRHRVRLVGAPQGVPDEWTARDREALALIKEHQDRCEELSAEQLSDRLTQERIVTDLALDLARHYHPGVDDPLAPVSPIEVVHTARFLLDDAAKWLDYYVPGSGHVPIGSWRRLSRIPSRLSVLGKLSATGSRWLRVRSSGPQPPSPACNFDGQRQGTTPTGSVNRILLGKLGYYLIELYSGRMKHQRYGAAASTEHRAVGPPEGINELTIAVVGAPAAGKSSLIRVLLGADRASKDRLPSAKHVSRYRVQLDEPLSRLVLLEADLRMDSVAGEFEWIAEHASLVVFVCDATTPVDAARGKLQTLLDCCTTQSVIAVMTHVDQMIEKPPSEWHEESSVVEAMWETIAPWREEFDAEVSRIVAACTDVRGGNTMGVVDDLIPVMARMLSDRQSRIFWRAIKLPESGLQTAQVRAD